MRIAYTAPERRIMGRRAMELTGHVDRHNPVASRSVRARLSVVMVAAFAVVAGACGASTTTAARGMTARAAQATGIKRTTSVSGRNAIPGSSLKAMRAALEAWSTFPVNATPRPLVLTTDPVSAPASGFRTTDAKEAFLSGAFVAPSALPAGPQHADGYPVVSAAQAFATMRAEGSPAVGAPRPPTPLVITDVRFGTSSFGTDRGTRLLPAWLFSFQDVTRPASVLAVDSSSRFPAPSASLGMSSVGARLDPDGRTATIRFVGAAPGRGPCTADYTVDQLPSNTAIAIRVRETRREEGNCIAVGYSRHANIVLASPLGNRVLVDATTKGPVGIAP
jgi:hypothetical protein